MQKIPLLFETDEQRKYVIPEVNPACEWVLSEPSIAHRKYDGTCLFFESGDWEDPINWWARRQVKGKVDVPGFRLVEFDPNTNKAFGWEPLTQSPFFKWWVEATNWAPLDCDVFDDREGIYESGTYELLGRKINGNPEKIQDHRLMPHNRAQQLGDIQALELDLVQEADRAYAELKRVLFYLPVEGVVFKNREMTKFAKLRRKDFDFSEMERYAHIQESRERQRNWLSPLSRRQDNDWETGTV